MIRTALTPKWLALLALVLVVGTAFGLLGYWQLTVSQNSAHAEAMKQAEAKPVVPLTSFLPPHTSLDPQDVGRTVTVTGTFDPAAQVQITPRRLGDLRGSWLVTGLRTSEGALVPVLRGFLPSGAAAPTVPAGVVSITGMVAPGEPPAEKILDDARTLSSLDLGVLVNRWPGSLVNGFVFPSDASAAAVAGGPPAASGAMSSSAITHVPPPDFGNSEVNWRNFAYALQWWCFALFALYMWWRMVRADARNTVPSTSLESA